MIIFVGQQPSRPSEPADALAGVTGRRLAGLVGIPFKRYLMHYRVNVNARFPGARNGAGDRFDILEGIKNANEILDKTRGGDVVVLCGRRVARVFALPYEPMKIWTSRGVAQLILPHPSGRNRYWNSPVQRDYCRALFQNEFGAQL